MKRGLCFILTLALLASGFVLPAHAQSAYPESAHNYADNACESWTYVYPGEALGLYVTFSAETELDGHSVYDYITEDTCEAYVNEFLEYGYYDTDGDYLELCDADGEIREVLRRSQAAGKTFFVSGDRFTITLHSDFANTGYGFAVTDVAPRRAGYTQVLYEIDGRVRAESVPVGEAVELHERYRMRQYGERMLVGWQTEDGRVYTYDNTFDAPWYQRDLTDVVLREGETCTFRPVWCPIALRREEVFSFTNDTRVFNADVDGYLFTRRDFLRIVPNWFAAFALTPLAPLAAVVCAVYMILWPTLPFLGSCCGFAVSALLQHYGKIDLLSRQGVSSVSELEPDDQIQSIINYYNIHAAACYPVNHIALQPGTEAYTEQLHALYDTLSGGTPVYFELYGQNPHPLRVILTGGFKSLDAGAHGVVLTGAYTDMNGNHILIMYDNNSDMYAEGSCNVVYIDPDFTQLYCEYGEDDILKGFSWNEDLSAYDSFKTTGVSDPFAWHRQFFKKRAFSLQPIDRTVRFKMIQTENCRIRSFASSDAAVGFTMLVICSFASASCRGASGRRRRCGRRS